MGKKFKVFISTASTEFKQCRLDLTDTCRKQDYETQAQELFEHTGTESVLLAIDNFIKDCDAVIHLIGDSTGSVPTEDQVNALLKRYPKFLQSDDGKKELWDKIKGNLRVISYTQWECYLALHHDIACFLYLPQIGNAGCSAGFVTNPDEIRLQQEHLDRLKAKIGFPRDRFANSAELQLKMLHALAGLRKYKRKRARDQRVRAVVSAVSAVIGGLALLWLTERPAGEWLLNASYDGLYLFGGRSTTNKLVLIQMDNNACEALGQERDKWDRGIHAQMLTNLAQAKLVVFDICFHGSRKGDPQLVAAMKLPRKVVLMADLDDVFAPNSDAIKTIFPEKVFSDVAAGVGIGHIGVESGEIVRRHWPFPVLPLQNTNAEFLSLPWVAAREAGVDLPKEQLEQWLRYYRGNSIWARWSYNLALSNPPTYFKDKIVFIGNEPVNGEARQLENDKFSVPHTHWNGQAVGGMDIMSVMFLNLLNQDWLRRANFWQEVMVLVLTGVILGGGWFLVSSWHRACVVTVSIFLLVWAAAILLSYFTNYWFPWLIIAGWQLPIVLICSWFVPWLSRKKRLRKNQTDALEEANDPRAVNLPLNPG